MFDILENISPWWWVALAFAIGALEMLTGTAVLIWISLSALIMAGMLALVQGVSGEAQITAFAVLSIVLTFLGRWAVARFGDGGAENATLNQRSNHLIGRAAKVIEFDADTLTGAVEIEGMRWRANWISGTTSKAGDSVHISDANGMILSVESK